jgi:hypothetical protein
MKGCRAGVLAVGLALAMGMAASATESGGGAYPNGAEDFMTGALPPPGNYFIDYVLWYNADQFMDDKGKKMPLDFDLTVWANVFRYVHVSKITILGASWAQHVFLPVMNMDVSMMGNDDSKSGLGDAIVDPLILGWHTPNVHVTAGLDVYIPTGAYDEDDLANLGRNYWTLEPVVALTFLSAGFEASVKAMYDVNLENDDTKIDSGDEFHADWTLGMHMANWAFGVGGYFYQQVTDDDYPAGYAGPQMEKGKTIGVGPQVSFQSGKMSFVLKYQQELETENKPEGQRAWFKFILPF